MSFSGKVGVVGQGYVGLALAHAIAKAGWKVYGIDIDSDRVHSIKCGESPIEDLSSADLQYMQSSLGYEISDDFELLGLCEIVIVCVPTPLDECGSPDLSILKDAICKVATNLAPRTLLINESTSFPGTVRKVIHPLLISLRGVDDVDLAVAPERVDPGNKFWNQRNTPRIVSGLTENSSRRAIDFYRTFCEKIVSVSSPEIAEFAKLLENSFRQVNIALVNELARLAHHSQVDIWEIIESAATKPYGFMKFKPSIGVGGHCIPVDPVYLTDYAQNSGVPLHLIELAQEINEEQPFWISSRARELLDGELFGKKIHLMGMAYKSGTADLRESPSIELMNHLVAEGAKVSWEDEKVSEFSGTYSSNIASEVDLLIVCQTPTLSETANRLSESKFKILDCTGTITGAQNVFRL